MVRSTEELDGILERTVEEANRCFPLTAAYLFGSYAEGKAHDASDIDIALFSPASDTMALPERLDALARIDIAVNAEVELHLYSDQALAEARPSNIVGHIIKTGRRIA